MDSRSCLECHLHGLEVDGHLHLSAVPVGYVPVTLTVDAGAVVNAVFHLYGCVVTVIGIGADRGQIAVIAPFAEFLVESESDIGLVVRHLERTVIDIRSYGVGGFLKNESAGVDVPALNFADQIDACREFYCRIRSDGKGNHVGQDVAVVAVGYERTHAEINRAGIGRELVLGFVADITHQLAEGLRQILAVDREAGLL